MARGFEELGGELYIEIHPHEMIYFRLILENANFKGNMTAQKVLVLLLLNAQKKYLIKK
eukprot:m.33070 g.33070  ORF g.33070 m.33070 type:complete len:59 (+) comp31753_c0_seq1:628-804(+)